MKPITPDISARPLECTIEQTLAVSPAVVYGAFTDQFDHWFAAPGTLLLQAEVNVPFFFETHMDGQRHPHYGRFLALIPGEHLALTWITGNPGTRHKTWAQSLGVDEYLSKPFRMERLMETAERLLSG